MATHSPVRVMLLEDDEATRLILTELLTTDKNFALVASFVSLSGGMTWLDSHAPDVMLADLQLKDGLSVEAIRKCAQRYPQCVIMVLTSSSELEHVDACIEAGATGYLLKEDGLHHVTWSIRDLVKGGAPMSPFVIQHVLNKARLAIRGLKRKSKEGVAGLTSREIQVLQLLEQGLSYEGCAEQLSISAKTVPYHIKNIYRKLAVNTRGQAVFEAKRRRII
ncbi:response regulator transcription factor [Oxalobacteraceae bacterium R-40]|uniref:Response regulator transcription factor n=1 Tax=Keguizhuia sedimenti TaxID=3064264 RepID=A0ABU1BT43_9BURK|nr:response regulator transcription factor [Oxalobacteraceae bacterium R-40]